MALAAPVFSHQLRLSKGMTFDGLEDFLLAQAVGALKHLIDCIKLEKVTVRFSPGRAGTAVTQAVEVILTLQGAVFKFC